MAGKNARHLTVIYIPVPVGLLLCVPYALDCGGHLQQSASRFISDDSRLQMLIQQPAGDDCFLIQTTNRRQIQERSSYTRMVHLQRNYRIIIYKIITEITVPIMGDILIAIEAVKFS